MTRLQRMFTANPFDDRFFDGAFRQLFDAPSMRAPFPALNVWEDGDKLIAEAEVPGLRLEEIELLALGTELTIKGRRPDVREANMAMHRQERGAFRFERAYELPDKVDADKAQAVMKNGVLTLTLPKVPEAQPKQIAVTAG